MTGPEYLEPLKPPLTKKEKRQMADQGLERARDFLYRLRTEGYPKRQADRTAAFKTRKVIIGLFPGLEEDVLNEAEIKERERVAKVQERIAQKQAAKAERASRNKRRLDKKD